MTQKAFLGFWRPLVHGICRLTHAVRVEGAENIPEDFNVLICCNHRGLLDPFMVGSFLPNIPFFMAKAEIFKVPVVRAFVRHAHAIPVRRGEADIHSVQECVRVLREGSSLLVFPEGTRSKTGEPLPPKTGVALLAAKSGCDVLPVAICLGGKNRLFTPITIRFGKVIKNEDLHLKEGKRSEAYTNASNKIMEEIVEMLPPMNGKKLKAVKTERKKGRLSARREERKEKKMERRVKRAAVPVPGEEVSQ